jgi:hypothetical protein
MVEYVPFLFDNFIADETMPILDLSVNHSEDTGSAGINDYSTSEILDKIRNKLAGIMNND